MEKINAIKGMNDILPATAGASFISSYQWEWLEDKVRSVMTQFAYRNIRTPIVESTHLFVRGLGDVTDIVENEWRCTHASSREHGWRGSCGD
jgi:histidyl-tRNA synthetase